MIRRLFCVLEATVFVAFVFSATATVAQAQTAAEIKCVNRINTAVAKLLKSVGKNNARCVDDVTKGKPLFVDVCIDGDPTGKLQVAVGRVGIARSVFCAGIGVFPPFGFTNEATAQQVPPAKERALVRDIFGADVQSSLDTSGSMTSRCQAGVIKAVEKLAATTGKDFVNCKKRGFKTGAIGSPVGLEACVGANLRGRIDKAKAKVDKTLNKRCPVDFDTAFGGDCSGPKSAFGACVKAKAIGRTCETINAVDGLSVGCDLVDDGILNGTSIQCNNFIVEAGETCDDGNNTSGDGCDELCQLE